MHLDIPTVNDRILPDAFVVAKWETVEKKDLFWGKMHI